MDISLKMNDELARSIKEEADRRHITRMEMLNNLCREGMQAITGGARPGQYPKSQHQTWAEDWPMVDKPIPCDPRYGTTGRCPGCNTGHHCNGAYRAVAPSFRPDGEKIRIRWTCACECVKSAGGMAPNPDGVTDVPDPSWQKLNP